jgi:RHS repeat-associated core domain protein
MNGKVIEETQPGLNPEGYVSIPFLFQGQYYDYETGLAYNRFRYYDPELGRYISEDPIRFASGTLALHSYVEDTNDWTDESGLSKYYGMLKDKSRKKRKPGRKKKRGRKPKKKTTGEANLQLLATSKRGRNAHRNYRNTLPSSYEFEVVLDNGRRVDAINFDEKIVRELKPDTPSGIAKGNSQLAEYVTQLEEQTGDTWTGFLDTYTP